LADFGQTKTKLWQKHDVKMLTFRTFFFTAHSCAEVRYYRKGNTLMVYICDTTLQIRVIYPATSSPSRNLSHAFHHGSKSDRILSILHWWRGANVLPLMVTADFN